MRYLKLFENFFEGPNDDTNIECPYYGLSSVFGIGFSEVKDLFMDILDDYPFLDFEIKTHVSSSSQAMSKGWLIKSVVDFDILLHDSRSYSVSGIKNVSDVEISDNFIQELNNRLGEYNLVINEWERLSGSIWFIVGKTNI
jgi:hypothetical protein